MVIRAKEDPTLKAPAYRKFFSYKGGKEVHFKPRMTKQPYGYDQIDKDAMKEVMAAYVMLYGIEQLNETSLMEGEREFLKEASNRLLRDPEIYKFDGDEVFSIDPIVSRMRWFIQIERSVVTITDLTAIPL